MNNWKNWCRLCAKHDETITNDIHFQLEIFPNLLQILNIVVLPQDSKPIMICNQCIEIIEKLHKFIELCTKTDMMFSQILLCNLKNENEILNIREQFLCNDTKNLIEKCNENEEIIRQDRTRNQKIIYKEINQLNIKCESTPNLLDETIKDELMQHSIIENKSKELPKPNEEFINDKYKEPNRQCENNGIFKCADCNKIFIKRSTYLNHLKSKHGSLKFFCTKCPKFFASKDSLRSHEKVHLPDSMKWIHLCTFCNKKFTKKPNLKAHIKGVHYKEISFVCHKCGKGFKLKCALQEHQLTHSDDTPFQCPDCPKKFKSLSRMKVHSDVHNDTRYPCNICGTTFRTKQTRLSHMDVHIEEKRFKCKLCGNEYKRNKALKRHMIGIHSVN